jgi:peptidyl-prolyl cis-trans isomerase A (cyclophilin A)
MRDTFFRPKTLFFVLALAASACAVAVGCGTDRGGSSSSEDDDDDGAGGDGGAGQGASGPGSGSVGSDGGAGIGGAGVGGAGGVGGCGEDVKAPEEVLPDTTDPEGGNFTMAEALVDLPQGPGPLRAIIETELGTLTCELFPDEAPIGVANFVGLARGRRAFKDQETEKWVKRRYYDGIIFHRIIDNFVIQGGDPLGTGYGGPGYQFVNEDTPFTHVPGTLAYANSGANTNGSQFYIAETAQPGLDGGYTIFGECGPLDVISALAAVPTGANDKPLTDVHMQTVTITRCAP